MNLIVAVDKNYGIGCKGSLLFHIPADLQYFKRKTDGKVVVMGDLTLQSLPGGKPLLNRTNIVLSHNSELKVEGVVVVNSLERLFEEIKNYESGDIFVIGGQTVYELLMPYCEYAYITEIDAEAPADRHLAGLADGAVWKKIEESPPQFDNGYSFKFCKYVNKNPSTWIAK